MSNTEMLAAVKSSVLEDLAWHAPETASLSVASEELLGACRDLLVQINRVAAITNSLDDVGTASLG